MGREITGIGAHNLVVLYVSGLVSQGYPPVHRSACQNTPATTCLALSSHRRGCLPGLFPSAVSPGGYSEDTALRHRTIGPCVWPSASSAR